MTDAQVEDRIKEFFEENYELLRLEGGSPITEEGRRDAFNQVIYYWRKMRDVATRVTETEVKLTLPDRTTPDGRRFTIEGVVDIIREDDETWMYDIKTHDPDYIRSNVEFYEKQLNVYAHIWQQLRGNPLDHTAVISTAYPQNLKRALLDGSPMQIEHELKQWQPLIEIPFDEKNLEKTVEDFGKVVDLIETNCFEPTSVLKLKEKMHGTKSLFATRVCRNCDGRFSCSSYRDYILSASGKSASTFKQYIEDLGDDLEKEEWVNANLNLNVINQLPDTTE